MKKGGVVLFHGFIGSIKDMENVEKCLIENDYEVFPVEFSGHGEDMENFHKVHYRDWIFQGMEAFGKCEKKYKDVHVVAHSMGGLVALYIAEFYNVKSLTLLATPVYYWDKKIIVKNVITDLKNKDQSNIKKYMDGMKNTNYNAMMQFLKLLHNTKYVIKNVNFNFPIFIVQGLKDDIVKKQSAVYLYKKLKSTKKLKRFYEDTDHLIMNSNMKDKFNKDLLLFLEKSENLM